MIKLAQHFANAEPNKLIYDKNITVRCLEWFSHEVICWLEKLHEHFQNYAVRLAIAVSTSIGYGASFNGLAALLAMLNSCAAGVGVVNIDNGFGAAMLAGKILRTAARLSKKSE